MTLDSVFGIPVTAIIEEPADILPAIRRATFIYRCPVLRSDVVPLKTQQFNTDFGLTWFFQCPACRRVDGWHRVRRPA